MTPSLLNFVVSLVLFLQFSVVLVAETSGETSDSTTSIVSSTCEAKPAPIDCRDSDPRCPTWAELNECENNSHYMKFYCPQSCDSCDFDAVPLESLDTTHLGVAQLLEMQSLGVQPNHAWKAIVRAYAYMEKKVRPNHPGLYKVCKNQHPNCVVWATAGECARNPQFMQKSCAPVCQSCHLLAMEDI